MIKKRIFFVFCALCLFFVSCKSNPTVDSVENEEKIETEVDSIDEQTETENLFEDENETESESSESVDEIGEDEDSVEEYLTDDSTIFDEPDIELEFEQELNDEENEDEDEDRFEDKIAAESDEANESSAGIELLTETNESNAESELENDSDPENNLILLEELEQAIKNTQDLMNKLKDVLEKENQYLSENKLSPEQNDSESSNFKQKTEEINSEVVQNYVAQSDVVPQNKEIKVFRFATLKVGQNLVANYPGKDWIYLGEAELPYGNAISSEIVQFKDKMTINDKTVFTLEAKKEGETLIHFYKVDGISQDFIDDYISVKVENLNSQEQLKYHVVKIPNYELDSYLLENIQTDDEKTETALSPATDSSPATSNGSSTATASSPKVSSPSAASSINSSPSAAGSSATGSSIANSSVTNSVQNENSIKEFASETIEEEPELVFADDIDNESSEEEKSFYETSSNVGSAKTLAKTLSDVQLKNLLESAKKHLDEKDYESAFSDLETFIESSTNSLDEAYFLLGNILEAKSSVRDIKKALYAYTYVVENFPESPFWEQSNQKEKYIKRFYFNIR